LRTPPLISVIDDDESFRVATDSLLRARGYAVHIFSSAAEFLRSPLLDETSCVITDVQMPEISGLQLQVLLREQGRTVPIILITAFPE
jgi:FixJ family two-component response regulator